MSKTKPEISKLAAELTKNLADDGLIVEAGWVGFLHACQLKEAPVIQLQEMRRAFYAGSLHVFSSMMSFLEPGEDPTEKDMNRMGKLCDELDKFEQDFKAQLGNAIVPNSKVS